MPAISELYEPITADLRKVCTIFDDQLFSELPIVNELCHYVRQYRGKMLRPALVLLAGRVCGKITDAHLTLAAAVELVHMATLVHGDVLDDAEMRRRCPTIHRMEGNEAAVLLGDYLFSHAFHLCSSLNSQFVMRRLGHTTNTICEGELQQIHHRGDFDLSEEQYLQIINRKTASLIGACGMLGAHLAGGDVRAVGEMEQYGLNAGMAFQITDDVLDLTGSEERMGKTLGRDLDKHKLTLPIIHGLAAASPELRRRLRQLLQAAQPDRRALCALLEETGSIAYAMSAARQYAESAAAFVQSLPPSEAREILQRVAHMIVQREQ